MADFFSGLVEEQHCADGWDGVLPRKWRSASAEPLGYRFCAWKARAMVPSALLSAQ